MPRGKDRLIVSDEYCELEVLIILPFTLVALLVFLLDLAVTKVI